MPDPAPEHDSPASASPVDRVGLIREWAACLREAQRVLHRLVQARDEAGRRMAQDKAVDALAQVTGSSSLDNAIATTQRIVQSLQTEIASLRRQLSAGESAAADWVFQALGLSDQPRSV